MKHPSPRSLQYDYAQGPMVTLGGAAISDERYLCMHRTPSMSTSGYTSEAELEIADASEPCTLNPQPSTPDPKSQTPNPETYTLNPKPFSLNPQPSTLSPQSSTLSPQTSTLNPYPSTPNPKP
jgi:hypothetical protein